jgi:hypothetical protein
METVHGTLDEHKATIVRAKAANPSGLSVWTGDIRRNAYLRENLEVMRFLNVADIELDDSDDQQSNFVIRWK